MARQHLYSRVPAKVSMFNRSDGYDTFAHSEGLSREFIERELSCVYENKLGKNDAQSVRQGLMPTVYSQCCLKSGDIAQTCITYLPLDYTGERSAYLAHTLLLSQEERDMLFCSKNNAPINTEMFITDITPFNISSASAFADSNFPCAEYKPSTAPIGEELLKSFRPDMLKSFIYAVFAVLCAKGKPVYFKLDCEDSEVSKRAIELISLISSVLPYHLRAQLSFTSYVTDPAQYPYAKVKALSADTPELHSSKAVFFDFHTDLAVGLPSEDVMANMPSQFFYSLIKDTAIRDEFLMFFDNAVKAVPTLYKTNFKILSDMVFLFVATCGLFDEKDVLPTDSKVYDFLCIYEKYRNTLSEEYRRNAYKCLARYPRRHEAIPKNILSKLSRLYPAEPYSAKRVAMNSVLELIHTDIMRDKLFTFVKNNYDGEDEHTKAVIHEDLCRVFYGGFLQPQILAFFFEHFFTEPEKTQDAVFEKLMLTVRTEAISEKILSFIKENFSLFTPKQKTAFYGMLFEMLPEGDKLSYLLADFLNEHIETEEEKEGLYKKLSDIIKADSRKAQPKLLPVICNNKGALRSLLNKLVLKEEFGKKLCTQYMALISSKTLSERIELAQEFAEIETDGKILSAVYEKMFAEGDKNTTLYHWIEAEKKTGNILLSEQIIRRAILDSLDDVFDIRLRPDGMAVLAEYMKDAEYVKNSDRAKNIKAFYALAQAAEKDNLPSFFKNLLILKESGIALKIGDTVKALLISKKDALALENALYKTAYAVLKHNKVLTTNTYNEYKESYIRDIQKEQSGKANNTSAVKMASSRAGERLFTVIKSAYVANEYYAQSILSEREALSAFLDGFVNSVGKKAEKTAYSLLSDAPQELYSEIRDILKVTKPKKSGLFKIFGR